MGRRRRADDGAHLPTRVLRSPDVSGVGVILDCMALLSAADVHDRHDIAALGQLDDRPGLRAMFEAERVEARPERRTLYFDAVTGWRVVDLCDLCGGDLGFLQDAPELAALCDACHDLEVSDTSPDTMVQQTGRLAG